MHLCVCVYVCKCVYVLGNSDLSQGNRPDGPSSVASDPRQLFQKALHRPGHLTLELCHHLGRKPRYQTTETSNEPQISHMRYVCSSDR